MLSPTSDAMSPDERRAGVSLAAIFALRMLGLFLMLPVLAEYAKTIPGGGNLTLVGFALGAYGLTPAAGKAFAGLKRAIEKAGLRLYVVSSYRSHAAQQALYASKLASMGRANTQKYVAVPGTSEHQTGLAVDLRSPGGRGTSFDNSREWRWLRAHAQNYGFVLRYPDGLTKVTGIGFEPWHWRYVGVEQAKAIRALGANMTIEQYLRLA